MTSVTVMSNADLLKNLYTTLYQLWELEKNQQELQPLNRTFFQDLSRYVKSLREELQSLDEKTWKAKLLIEEQKRIKTLLSDLALTRFQKMLDAVKNERDLTSDQLTTEEEYSYNALQLTWKHIQTVITDILRGRPPKIASDLSMRKPKRLLIRFLQAIPAIVGPDMKTYGPFKEEDVAYLPTENAEVLIKRNIAIEV
jgi:DNA replication factor GINS